jgi:hypothetical protein
MTECTQQSVGFEGHFRRRVTAEFDGGQELRRRRTAVERDGSATETVVTVWRMFYRRDRDRIEHTVDELVAQQAVWDCPVVRGLENRIKE